MALLAECILVACQPNSESSPDPSPVYTLTASSTPTLITTTELSSTASPSQATSATSTLIPSLTPTPTETMSFNNVAACLPKNSGYERAMVTNVIDGDTIEVQFMDGITGTVRYIGVDAPELNDPLYGDAKQANSDLVFSKEVVLVKDLSELDQFNRLLRYVIVGDAFVNKELVRQGFAKAVNYPPDETCKAILSAAELDARQASAGMWVPAPTPEPNAGQVVILTVDKREEWVDIQNIGNYAVDLVGWNLVSERGHQECPLSGSLEAGETLRIWAMELQGAGFSCGYNSPIWNNSEADPAVLYNTQGVEVSRK